jgi:AMP-polyphosphate phosphotransferase
MPEALGVLEETRNISKQAFKNVQRDMLERIAGLAELVYEQKRAAIIVFEGWDASGKGTTIRALTEHLDARGYKVLATQAPRTHEKQKPWLWRFWMNLPRYGQIAIFDRSWYGRVLVERVRGLTPMPEWIAAYEEINQFERTLADDGTIFLKFWLHISRREQLRRFMLLTQDPSTAWQVTAEDWENHRLYDEYVAAVRDMLASTNKPCAPWAVVDATDREVRMYSVCGAMIDRLEQALDVPASAWPSLEELAASSGEAAAKAGKTPKHPKPAKADKQEKDKAKDKAGALDAADGAKDGAGKQKKKDKDKKKKHLRPDAPASSEDGGDGFGARDGSADDVVTGGGMVMDSGEEVTAEGGAYA